MTKAEFVAKYGDEICGLLVSSFAYQEQTKAGTEPDMATRGRLMLAQMRRGKAMLEKMYEELNQPAEKPK